MKFFIIFFVFGILFQQEDFLQKQLKYSRFRTAKEQKESIVKKMFDLKNIEYPSNKIYIRIFKSEAKLEIWALNKTRNTYVKIKTYNICALSGNLGPKRKRGDLQIPEGFYFISKYNPVSSFYLALKINYPNKSDKILGVKQNLGGDIFIHGDCVTIGCVPVTDNYIKELYLMAVLAKAHGQNKIPVHIFPTHLNEDNYNQLKIDYKENADLLKFWENLKQGYQYFENEKQLPGIKVDKFGKYIFN